MNMDRNDIDQLKHGGFFNRPGWPDRQPAPEPDEPTDPEPEA